MFMLHFCVCIYSCGVKFCHLLVCSRAVGVKELLVMPGGGYTKQQEGQQEGGGDGLALYPPTTNGSHSSSGLKSPDSGVNVSILE